MAFVRIPQAGQLGVNADLSSAELPNNAWTDARNVRFLDGMAFQFLGHGEVYPSASVIPYHVLPVYVGANRYWLYAGLSKIYCVSGYTGSTVHTNLTRQTAGVDVNYSGAANAWTSTSLSGIAILNPGNTSDPPQRWDLDVTHKFVALDNWPASTYCRSLRAYRNFLVALNVTKGSTNYPYMVKWSAPAVPGAVPGSWDETDTTKDAGETDLAEGGDPVQDGLQLGPSFIIYKERSIWRMDYTGGPYVFSFTKVLGTSGAMNRNCVVEIDGYHVVLTNDDVLVHDGQSSNSILDKQTRRKLFQSIDAQNAGLCFVFKNPFLNEVYVCYPEAGNSVPNLALVWNFKDKTVAFREIPSLWHANFGPVEGSVSQPWDADSSPWNSDISGWNAAEFTPDTVRVLMASNDQKLYLLDSSTTFNGSIPTAYLERRGLAFDLPEQRKLVRGIRLRIKGATGETVILKVGAANDAYSDPTYTSMTYTFGQSNPACDCLVSGRHIAVRVESGTAYQWRLDSFDLDVEPEGYW